MSAESALGRKITGLPSRIILTVIAVRLSCPSCMRPLRCVEVHGFYTRGDRASTCLGGAFALAHRAARTCGSFADVRLRLESVRRFQRPQTARASAPTPLFGGKLVCAAAATAARSRHRRGARLGVLTWPTHVAFGRDVARPTAMGPSNGTSWTLHARSVRVARLSDTSAQLKRCLGA